MDITVIDTRVKSLMKSDHLSCEEATHLLKVCNWDVIKARSIIAQRKEHTSGGVVRKTVCDSEVTVHRTQVMKPTPATIEELESEEMTALSTSDGLTRSEIMQDSAPEPDNVDMPGPRLQRGMSKATINIPIVLIARDILQKDAEAAMIVERRDDDDAKSFIQTTEFTFMLPDLTCFPEDFKAFLYKDLIDTATLVSLEQGGHLNWWADVGACQRLLPMVTSGDGNCLLHAASLGMWGLHDRQLILRKLLCDALTNSSATEAFKRRWRYQQSISHRLCNLILSEEEWESDWKFLVHLSSPQPRSVANRMSRDSLPRYERSCAGQSQQSEVVYESLEEFHVFVLAHVLRRPIIIIAKAVLQDANGEALAPIPFGGIYLPLEWDARQCHSAPLLLTYDLSHFCALVPMETPSGSCSVPLLAEAIPLVSPHLELLPIHFAVDPGSGYDFSKYLDFSLSRDEKMNLIRNYFVVENILIPHVPREPDSFPESIGTSTVLKTELSKSDSEESGGSGRDRASIEEFEKKSVPKPVKFITKSFDTLGSKLKNITKMNKVGRLERKASIGMATQSTRTSSLTTEMLENQNFILCARIRQRKTGYQDQLVGNYIAVMREKFSTQQIRRQEQNAEIKRLSIERLANRTEDFGKSYGDQTGISGFEVMKSQRDSRMPMEMTDKAFQRQDTIVVAGKSKFYTDACEDQCPAVEPPWDLRKPEEPGKKESGDSEVGKVRKYNKLETLQLQSVGETDEYGKPRIVSKEKQDLMGWGTIPRHGTKVGLEGVPSRKAPSTNKQASDRYTVDGSLFRNFSNTPSEQYTKLATTMSRNPGNMKDVISNPKQTSVNDSGSSAGPPLNRELERENGFRIREADQRLCRTENCKFYGTYKTNFLCSHCYKTEKTSKSCRTANCLNNGNPAQENLCKMCFQKKHYSHQVQYPTAKTKF